MLKVYKKMFLVYIQNLQCVWTKWTCVKKEKKTDATKQTRARGATVVGRPNPQAPRGETELRLGPGEK